MLRIAFSGIPGCGKTTSSRAFSAMFKPNGKTLNIEVITEHARTYMFKYGPPKNVWEQYLILDKQIDLEQSIPDAVELLITDSPLQLALQYALDLRDPSSKKDSMVIDDIFHKLNNLNTPPRYDIIFHLPPVIDPVKDGIRPDKHFDKQWRQGADESIKILCKKTFPCKKFVEVDVIPLMDRVEFCCKISEEYIKSLGEKV